MHVFHRILEIMAATAAYVLLVIRGLEHVALTEINSKLQVVSIEILTLQADPAQPRLDVERGEAAVGKLLLYTMSSLADVKSLCSIQACLAYLGHTADIATATSAGLNQIGMLVERASTWSAALALWKDVHHDPPPPSSKEDAPSSALRFRGSCVRDGKHAYSSEAIAGAVGTAVLNLHPKWTVSLSDFDVEVVALVMHSHVVCGISLAENSKTINYRGGRLAPEARHLSSLQYISTLRPSTAYLMLQLAKCQPGDVVLDCMCGVGTLPACAVRWGRHVFGLGGDVTRDAVDQASANCTGQYASICQWSAENLPLRAACVDRILVDMPFGIRCGNSVNNSKLYPKAIAEMARVLRLHGIAVLLVMSKKLLMHSVRNTPSLVLVDALQVNIGGLGVGVFVLQKTSPHRAPRHKPATSTASKRKLQQEHVPPTTV